MKPKIDPLFLSNSKGEKIAVMLKIEEFEQIMKQLESMESAPESKMTHKKVKAEVVFEKVKVKKSSKKRKTKLVFKKTEAELDFEKSEAAMELEKSESETNVRPNNFYTKSIITKPVTFEMQDEFCSAKGVLLADGKNFRVIKGSKASGIIDKNLSKEICHLLEELEMLRVLVKDTTHGDMIFARDYEFDNPNDAASTIAASPRDGGHCWIATENGKPMRQY